MLNIVRRGPASVAISFYTKQFSLKCIRAARPLDAHHSISQNAFLNAARLFGTSIQLRRSAAATAAYEDEAIEAEIEQEVNAGTPHSDTPIKRAVSHGPVTKFQELADRGMVCNTVVRTIIREMGIETMTPVQSLTINETLKGTDVLAQAKTGTGKTLAFLLPVLQNIINVDPNLETRSRLGRMGSSSDIRAIIISPTRELAEQIAVQARNITRDTGVIVQTAVGGSHKSLGLRKIKTEGCHILVGTPGRLHDILSDPHSRVRAPKLSAFVLDEADRLLDQGFAPEIAAIQDQLPSRTEVDRQTLLYSATVPREVMQIVRNTMKPNFKFVRTVQEGEQQTHEKVPQRLVNVGGFENLMPALVELFKREIKPASDATASLAKPFKAIVYFSATAEVSLASSMLQNLRNPGQSIFHQHPLHPCRIIEMHAKLTQEQRTRAANSFRRTESGILVSSDVTARGMDFPNVTHVIQIGLPPSEEQYVHRIGRTARGDKTGEGWLLVTNLEARELRRKLPNMPLQGDKTLETAKVDMRKDAQLPEDTAKILTQVGDAAKMVPRPLKVKAYMANLGVFQWVSNKQALIDGLNDNAKYGWGMDRAPSIAFGLVQKLGLSRVQGINIGSEERDDRGKGERGGFAAGYGGGRSPSGYGGRDRYTNDRNDREGGDRNGRYGSRDRYTNDRNNREGGDYKGGHGGRDRYSNDRNDRGGFSKGGGGFSYGRGSVGGFGGRGR